ncbi:hypothetical protein ACFQZ4_34445 [Catellatospora coxensis]|uniref:Uncharacterized protein n=1 Tax=Catellatospora coxensis TaxID=310354 RepID=A0A8J3LF88_9ACTN|nr:hypothetical protein [Catellatospora coxensis]GIG11625.1 hypothetical protein Cco03nite_83250 [Catellatospora coxensis]
MNATAFADQARAAVRDARGHLAQFGPDRPMDIGTEPWLADQVSALFASLEAGSARFCPHVTASPMVLHTTAWTPGVLVCGHCAPQLRPATDLEDSTCDRCRRYTRRIHSAALAVGAVLLTFGLCPDCMTAHPDYQAATS